MASPYLAVQEEVVRFYVPMDESQLMDGVDGEHGLSDVELRLLFCQSVLLHQQCHHVTWKPPTGEHTGSTLTNFEDIYRKKLFLLHSAKTSRLEVAKPGYAVTL